MKYRIQIVMYASNEIKYIPQVSILGIIWSGIDCWGRRTLFNLNENVRSEANCMTRHEALKIIDMHYNAYQMSKIKSIEFEYINKP